MPRRVAYDAPPMNILVTGSSGFIGSALVSFLVAKGHTVTRLVRTEPAPGERQARWDPEAGEIDVNALGGIDAAVHLAGEGIGSGRWTPRRKARILDSRVMGTRLLSETLAGLDPLPKVLASASAKDYYGDRGDEALREDSGPGSGFLADVCRQWEAATLLASEAGIRVVNMRFSLALGPGGGALARMLPAFRLGVAGKVGSGRQLVSWITLEDIVRAIYHTLTADGLEGPVNLVAPEAVTNAAFTRTLGRVLSRPTLMPAPAFALRIVFGEMIEPLLTSVRMDPAKLLATGFEFHHPELEGALRAVLGKPRK